MPSESLLFLMGDKHCNIFEFVYVAVEEEVKLFGSICSYGSLSLGGEHDIDQKLVEMTMDVATNWIDYRGRFVASQTNLGTALFVLWTSFALST